MADNFLERQYEEYLRRKAAQADRKSRTGQKTKFYTRPGKPKP